MYLGSSIRNLQERLQERLTTKSSPVYKYKNDGPVIQLITLAPCKDRQELNKVEIEYIRQYSNKYGDRLLNKKSVPKQTVKIIRQHVAEIENENQPRQRLRENFGDKLKIKDDPKSKLQLYYDAKIDGKRYKTMARYKKCTKEQAMKKITVNQQELVEELKIQWS